MNCGKCINNPRTQTAINIKTQDSKHQKTKQSSRNFRSKIQTGRNSEQEITTEQTQKMVKMMGCLHQKAGTCSTETIKLNIEKRPEKQLQRQKLSPKDHRTDVGAWAETKMTMLECVGQFLEIKILGWQIERLPKQWVWLRRKKPRKNFLVVRQWPGWKLVKKV